MISTARVLGGVLLVVSTVACAAGPATTTTVPSTTTIPTTTTAPAQTGSVIAEFRTPDGVTYRILLEGEAAVHARQAFARGDHAGIPNGKINPGDGGVNIGHEWHITEVEWADMAIEVCDGNAGYIDDLGYEEFVNQHGERFCPWSAELIELIEP